MVRLWAKPQKIAAGIPAGASADLYLQSQPGKHFRGTVVGLLLLGALWRVLDRPAVAARR